MPKLLVFSHSAVVNVNRELYRQMVRARPDLELTLVVPARWKGDLIEELRFQAEAGDESLAIVQWEPRFRGRGSYFFYTESVAKLVRERRPDHVFVHEEPWSLMAGQIFGALPAKTPSSFFTNQNLLKELPPPFSWIEKFVHARASLAWSLSHDADEVLRAKGFQKRIAYLPFSYDPGLFRPIPEAARMARKRELGLRDDRPVIGYCGRITPEKGIEDLMAAQARLGPQTQFIWIGNGPWEDRVSPRVPAVSHDRFGATLGALDVLVLPSRTTKNWKEQFGRVIVEAMACGVAVVGSNSGEIPRLIERMGGGLTFPEGDSSALAERLVALTEPVLRDELAKRGLASARSEFTHEAVARKMLGEFFG